MVVRCAARPRPSGRVCKAQTPWRVNGARWASTCLRMMSSGAPPHDAAKRDGDHRTPFLQCPVISGRALRGRRPDTPFRLLSSLGEGHLWRVADEQVHVVVLPVAFERFGLEVAADLREDVSRVLRGRLRRHVAPTLRDKDRMGMKCKDAMPAGPMSCRPFRRPIALQDHAEGDQGAIASECGERRERHEADGPGQAGGTEGRRGDQVGSGTPTARPCSSR